MLLKNFESHVTTMMKVMETPRSVDGDAGGGDGANPEMVTMGTASTAMPSTSLAAAALLSLVDSVLCTASALVLAGTAA